MIFATVGYHSQGFERLVRKLDEIAPALSEDVIVQLGFTKYEPKNAQYFRFKPYEEVLQFMRDARIIVSHGGSSMIDALKLGKPTILVARLRRYGEAVDNHQLDLARHLEQQLKVTVVYDLSELEALLKGPYKEIEGLKGNKMLVNFLRKQVDDFLAAKKRK